MCGGVRKLVFWYSEQVFPQAAWLQLETSSHCSEISSTCLLSRNLIAKVCWVYNSGSGFYWLHVHKSPPLIGSTPLLSCLDSSWGKAGRHYRTVCNRYRLRTQFQFCELIQSYRIYSLHFDFLNFCAKVESFLVSPLLNENIFRSPRHSSWERAKYSRQC